MPEEGINYLPKTKLLSYEEMLRIVKVLVNMGINKVRITGGEPFVRHNLIDFLYQLSAIAGLQEINLTTNGVLTGQYIQALKDIGVRSINLSLDTLDPQRFFEITRRNEFDKVYRTLFDLLDAGFHVKLNAVVMEGKNTDDLIPLAELSKDYPVGVRFIEEMPFNGAGANYPILHWNQRRILATLQEAYPNLQKITDSPSSTSANYQVPGYQGTVGIIAAFSRTFCGTCNRIRMTAQGELKTCLYDEGGLSIRDLIRSGIDDEALSQVFKQTFANRAKDGFEAEKRRSSHVSESMTTIGG